MTIYVSWEDLIKEHYPVFWCLYIAESGLRKMGGQELREG